MSYTYRTDKLLDAIGKEKGSVNQRNCPRQWVGFAIELETELQEATFEIERLRKSNLQLREGAEEQKQRIHSLISERDTARMQADQKVSLREEFRELLGTDDIEQGVDKVRVLKQFAAIRLGYIKQLEQENDAMRADLLLWNDQEAKP